MLPYFNFSERRDIYAPKGIETVPSLFDELESEGRGYRVYTYHQCSDAEIFRGAKRDIAETDATLFFLYLCEMDGFLHLHCKEPEAIAEKLQWYDEQLREVFAVAPKRDREASLMVCSDHGMTPVMQHADLVGEVEKLGLRMPQVTGVMQSLDCGRILSQQELKKFGLNFSDDRYGELIFLLNPGWMVAESDFNGRGWFPEGMHGYHPDDFYSDAIFLSNQKPIQPMRTIGDVYYTIRGASRETKEKVAL